MRLPRILRLVLSPALFWVGLLGFVMKEVGAAKHEKRRPKKSVSVVEK